MVNGPQSPVYSTGTCSNMFFLLVVFHIIYDFTISSFYFYYSIIIYNMKNDQ